MVKMRDPLLQDEPERTLMEGNEEVQTLAAQRTAETFAHCLRLGCPQGRRHHAHSHRGSLFIPFLGENAVPVGKEVGIGRTARERRPELLPRPFRRGVGGPVVGEDSRSAQFHNHQSIQPAEGGADHNEEALAQSDAANALSAFNPSTAARGYKNLRYLPLKPQRMTATRTEFIVFTKAA